MLRYECDNCKRLKEPGETWLLGFAAETMGAVSARREVSIASAWDDARAIDRLAVHFCSDRCRARYIERLFGDQVADEVESEELVPAAKVTVRKTRAVVSTPASVVKTTKRVVRAAPARARKRAKRKRAA